jgi:hypothetical protein
MIRHHKVKTNGANGRLGEKIAAVLCVLTAINFFGRFNIFRENICSSSGGGQEKGKTR